MAKTVERLSEFVFISVAHMTLARRDAYLAHVKTRPKTVNCVQFNQIRVWRDFKDLPASNTFRTGVCLAVVRHEQCFRCRTIVFCKKCTKCKNCCSRSTCRGKTSLVLRNLGNLGGRTKGHKNPPRGLHPSLLDPTELDKVTDHHKLLCKSWTP